MEDKAIFIRLPGVIGISGVQKTFIWENVKKGTFPQPIKLSRRVTVWVKQEVEAWVQEQIDKARNPESKNKVE